MGNTIPFPLSKIDEQLADLRALVETLIFIQEEADAGKLESLHDATVAMLYMIDEKIVAASGNSGALHRHAYQAANQ